MTLDGGSQTYEGELRETEGWRGRETAEDRDGRKEK